MKWVGCETSIRTPLTFGQRGCRAWMVWPIPTLSSNIFRPRFRSAPAVVQGDPAQVFALPQDWLAWLLEPLARRWFSWETRKRVVALQAALEKPVGFTPLRS